MVKCTCHHVFCYGQFHLGKYESEEQGQILQDHKYYIKLIAHL